MDILIAVEMRELENPMKALNMLISRDLPQRHDDGVLATDTTLYGNRLDKLHVLATLSRHKTSDHLDFEGKHPSQTKTQSDAAIGLLGNETSTNESTAAEGIFVQMLPTEEIRPTCLIVDEEMAEMRSENSQSGTLALELKTQTLMNFKATEEMVPGLWDNSKTHLKTGSHENISVLRKDSKTYLNTGSLENISVLRENSKTHLNTCSRENISVLRKNSKTHMNTGSHENISVLRKNSKAHMNTGSHENISVLRKNSKAHMNTGSHENISVLRKNSKAHLNTGSHENISVLRENSKTHLKTEFNEKMAADRPAATSTTTTSKSLPLIPTTVIAERQQAVANNSTRHCHAVPLSNATSPSPRLLPRHPHNEFSQWGDAEKGGKKEAHLSASPYRVRFKVISDVGAKQHNALDHVESRSRREPEVKLQRSSPLMPERHQACPDSNQTLATPSMRSDSTKSARRRNEKVPAKRPLNGGTKLKIDSPDALKRELSLTPKLKNRDQSNSPRSPALKKQKDGRDSLAVRVH